MSWCDDRYKHEREGRDAARWGPDYSHEVQERLYEGRYDRESCDGAFKEGYDRELRNLEEREQEERAQEAANRRAYEALLEEERAFEEYGYE